MKKYSTLLLCGVLALAGGCSAEKKEEPAAEGKFTPGTYTGTAAGFGGDVTAELTVDANNITTVVLTGNDETPTVGGAALETLIDQVMDAQSAEIDGVSGATMTSNGVKQAVEKALNAAMGIEEEAGEVSAVPDGTYNGKTPGFGVVPALFCIGEPLTFGVPMVLNFQLAIPYFLNFVINGVTAYLATAAGFIGRTFVSVPWTLPHFLQAFLTTMDIKAVLLYFILVVVNIIILIPFVKRYDKQLLEQEQASQD